MSRVARSGLLYLFAAVAAAVLLASCRREAPSNVDRNKSPETYLTRAPAESSLAYYRVRMYWSGSDPDGSIAYYEIAVTDSNNIPGQNLEEGTGYTRTLATDSLFVLKADPPIEQQILGHRLYVRAVDNEGKVDPTPALAYFVAKNDYYPEVRFRPGQGSWTDACGEDLNIPLTSSDASAPTDTLGIGATVRWSWGGFDGDPGGSVKGFIYKLSSQFAYSGGTLADTAFQITFPINAGRRQILQVRAIDDGGLRSLDDFTRSVVLDFDPITMIVYPPSVATEPDGSPKRGNVFLEKTVVYPSGTTLADDYHQIFVYFTGKDDPRDLRATCGAAGIKKYQYRILFRDDSEGTPGGGPFLDLNASLAYPQVNNYTINQAGSGDSFLLIRAVDDRDNPDATPEVVLIKVNYSPYLIQLTAGPESAPPAEDVDLLAKSELEPTQFRLGPEERLRVSLLGIDYHAVNPSLSDSLGRLAALFDPNHVVQDEKTGQINRNEAYRAFLETAQEPGFDPAPGADVRNPYTTYLEAPPAGGVFKLFADVKDATNTNGTTGRRGRVIRYVQIVR